MELRNLESFDINNIFLGTIKYSDYCDSFIEREEYDLFYKTENGYTRYIEEGPETFKGDNSDGKGIIVNLVPALKYFKESEIQELSYNGYKMIACQSIKPLKKYNKDYNKKGFSFPFKTKKKLDKNKF